MSSLSSGSQRLARWHDFAKIHDSLGNDLTALGGPLGTAELPERRKYMIEQDFARSAHIYRNMHVRASSH